MIYPSWGGVGCGVRNTVTLAQPGGMVPRPRPSHPHRPQQRSQALHSAGASLPSAGRGVAARIAAPARGDVGVLDATLMLQVQPATRHTTARPTQQPQLISREQVEALEVGVRAWHARPPSRCRLAGMYGK